MENEKTYFNKILDFTYRKLGLNCKQYNESYIKRRLNSRIIAYDLNQNDYYSYFQILESDPNEIRKLFDSLTINVTNFFRDSELWNVLKSSVLPQIIKEKKAKFESMITVWSCGCSSGEEPYSIAILLKELFFKKQIIFKIIATDIDNLSLKKAEEGLYDSNSVKNVSAEYLQQNFKKIEGKDLYEINSSIKSLVNFSKHDFFNEKPPRNDFDLILCRNVIIYFTPNSKQKIVDLFYSSLNNNGWLVIGKSEILFEQHLRNKFCLYDDEERIYRKKEIE